MIQSNFTSTATLSGFGGQAGWLDSDGNYGPSVLVSLRWVDISGHDFLGSALGNDKPFVLDSLGETRQLAPDSRSALIDHGRHDSVGQTKTTGQQQLDLDGSQASTTGLSWKLPTDIIDILQWWTAPWK